MLTVVQSGQTVNVQVRLETSTACSIETWLYQYMQVPGTFAHVGFNYSPNYISKYHEAKKNASIASKVGSVYALGERSSVNQ